MSSQGQTQKWWGAEEFSAALALEGAESGQGAGKGWWGSVQGSHGSVLCGGPVHSVCDHSLPLPPHHSRWSSHQRPVVSHKYSSLRWEEPLKRRERKISGQFPSHGLYQNSYFHYGLLLPQGHPLALRHSPP